VGIVDTRKAIEMARAVNLDLVEVAPNANPPVCRIMDFGKYKYDQKKKERRSRSKHHTVELKEVRIKTPKISQHDLHIKIDRARQFLQRGDRVQFSLRFRGREMAHVEMGKEIFESIKASLADVSKVERDMRLEGRRLVMVLSSTVSQTPSERKNQTAKKQPEIENQPVQEAESSNEAADNNSPDSIKCQSSAE